MLSSVTRTLALAGTILFAINTSGVELSAEEPAAIEPGQKAIEIAVQANSDFAFDMYRQLAKENEGQERVLLALFCLRGVGHDGRGGAT